MTRSSKRTGVSRHYARRNNNRVNIGLDSTVLVVRGLDCAGQELIRRYVGTAGCNRRGLKATVVFGVQSEGAFG